MSRIEQKLYWAVREESVLREVPLPETDRLPSGELQWPAEDPGACSRVLVDWCVSELITVMRTDDEIELSSAEARELLAAPQRWGGDHALVLTEAGLAALRVQEA